jgi:hypothetical protein
MAGVIPGAVGGGEIEAALDAFRPAGDVPEPACGPGTWTAQLLRHADRLTAVDASPEMLALAAAGYWLSHVPPERFEAPGPFYWGEGARG